MKLKKLQLTTVLLFILTILLMIIGLFLISLNNGFSFLRYNKVIIFLKHSATYLSSIVRYSYYKWLIFQIGVIFCVILVPILGIITWSLFFLIIGLKIKVKNNNFWDAIQNCEIISNYYIH